MTRYLLTASLLLAGAVWIPAGCSFPSCTEIGCYSYFRANFTKSSGWADGRWEISLRTGGTTVGSCEIDLPAPSASGRGDCSGDLLLRLRPDGQAIESATSQRDFSDNTPSEFTVRLERDGQQVAQQTFSPEFDRLQPNGPGCSPVCHQAEVEFAF